MRTSHRRIASTTPAATVSDSRLVPIEPPDPCSYTPKRLAEKILTSRSALEGERKQATILFADVRGSTELVSELDPEKWHRIMDRFFQILAEGVHRFEGSSRARAPSARARADVKALPRLDPARRFCESVLLAMGRSSADTVGRRRTRSPSGFHHSNIFSSSATSAMTSATMNQTTQSLMVRPVSHLANAPSLASPPEEDDTEGARVLRSLAHRKTGRIPVELLVRHVIAITTSADWPVRRAAMEALLRRLEFAERDLLRVASRPAGRRFLGTYTTRSAARGGRPYRSLLTSIDPLRGSCNCTDFLHGSLGLCKHLLTVLEDVGGRDRELRHAIREEGLVTPAVATVTWDPIRPLTGAGDWIDRIEIREGGNGETSGLNLRRLLRTRFGRDRGGTWRLEPGRAENPAQRLALVRELLQSADPDGRPEASPGILLEPAVRALLEGEQTRLELVSANLADLARLRGAIATLEKRLYPYQRGGVERFLGCGRLLLADDMGLGKTAQAIAACHALFHVGRIERGLVIVPASLKPQWLREWQLFTKAPIAVVEGPPEDRRRAYRSQGRGFLIANYEQALRDLDMMHAFAPEIVVLDEAQRIKNWATRTAAAVKTLKPRYRLVLTGTPMENRLEELASLLDFLDEPALEPKWRLAPWHARTADGKREVIGAKELGTLRTRLSQCMLRRSRAEVLKQLPPRTDTSVPVAFTDAQRDEHDALNQPIAKLLQITNRRPLTQAEFLKLMQLLTMQRVIANGLAQYQFERVWEGISRVRRPDETLLASLSSPKLLELRQIVAQVVIEQERKIVVFSQWRRMLRLAQWAISDLLADAGLRAAFFTGEERARQRTRNLVDFHDDPSVQVLFATDAGGVGLNLQRAASACVNLELPWNPAVLEQRIGRIYRLGQKRPIDVWNLVTQSSIEERILGLVAGKRALFNGLFDGTSEEVRFDRAGSFIGQLLKIIPPAPAAASIREADSDASVDEAADMELEKAIDLGDGVESAPTEGGSSMAAGTAEPQAVVERERAAISAREIEGLFAGVTVRARADRGVVIEADPEAASALISIFQGMAGLLGGLKQAAAREA